MSTWPVASGVLVEDGTAYFAAGIMDLDGTHVYALDAATGRIRWENNTAGHLDAWSRRGVTCQGEMLLDGGKLYLAGGNTVSPAAFDAKTGQCLNPPPGGMGSSAPRGRELHLAGANVQVSGQPLYSLPDMPVFDQSVGWSEVVVHTKNAELSPQSRSGLIRSGWSLAAKETATGKPLWRQPLAAEPVRWGIAVDAEGRILVALLNGEVVCFGAAR
jgi:outer membrane protein assembly factor BamB